jgi:hypothetical protein
MYSIFNEGFRCSEAICCKKQCEHMDEGRRRGEGKGRRREGSRKGVGGGLKDATSWMCCRLLFFSSILTTSSSSSLPLRVNRCDEYLI